MKRLSGTLGIGLALVWGLLILVTGTPQVQAQTEYITSTSKVFLPLIWRGIDVPTAQWATQTKANSGIHLGNRNTDWQDKNSQYTFLDQVGHTAAGFWPAAVVVQSEQLYEFQRFDSLCQVSGARVKKIGGKDYELYRYLTEGVTHHHVKVVIRITPSPGNFSDFDHPGPNHVLLTTEAPPNRQDYCGDTNTKIHRYRDILDLAKEMRAIYLLNAATGWPLDAFFFEPANEPNQEWYQSLVESGIVTLTPKIDNKQAWIEMDNYFAALYDRAIALQPNLKILAPSMSQGLLGEHYNIGTCIPMTVFGGNGRSGMDFMKKVYGYDIGIKASTTPKASGFAWHNYWRKDHEMWLPPYRGGSFPPTVDEYCQAHLIDDPDNQYPYKPPTDHFFQYLSEGMEQSMVVSPTFITEGDLKSPCQLDEEGVAVSKDADALGTSTSLRTFIEQETQARYNTGYGAQYVIAWLLVNQFDDEATTCKSLGADGKKYKNVNYEQNWHEAYREDGQQREWFTQWWSKTP